MPAFRLNTDRIDDALSCLGEIVELQQEAAPSHTVLRVAGLEEPAAVEALGVYLTAVVAGAVSVDASLAEEFLHFTPDPGEELARRVRRVVRDENTYETIAQKDFIDRSRNPWIAEGIGHLLLVLRARQETLCLPGPVEALKPSHTNVKEAGIDLLAVYLDADVPALAIGEGKATRLNAGAELSKAVTFFGKVDRGERDEHIIDGLLILQAALEPEVREQLGEAIWRERCAYLPLIVFEQGGLNAASDRPAIAALAPPVEQKRLIVVELAEFRNFFNNVANSMRAAPTDVLA